LTWDSAEAFGAAAATDGGEEIFADVPNFTDLQPIILKGDVKGTWSA
jgi:hypothetical protein